MCVLRITTERLHLYTHIILYILKKDVVERSCFFLCFSFEICFEILFFWFVNRGSVKFAPQKTLIVGL